MQTKATRRQFLSVPLSLVATEILSACGAPALYAVVNANSILFLKEVLVHVAADVITPYVSPTIDRVFETLRDPGSIIRAARAAGANEDIALEAAKVSGERFVTGCIKNGTIMWCQYNANVDDVNSFKVDVQNDFDMPKGGQIKFALSSPDGQIDQLFWEHPFGVPARSKAVLHFRTKGVFLPRIGSKTIIAVNYPEGLRVNSVNLEVVPLSIRI